MKMKMIKFSLLILILVLVLVLVLNLLLVLLRALLATLALTLGNRHVCVQTNGKHAQTKYQRVSAYPVNFDGHLATSLD